MMKMSCLIHHQKKQKISDISDDLNEFCTSILEQTKTKQVCKYKLLKNIKNKMSEFEDSHLRGPILKLIIDYNQ